MSFPFVKMHGLGNDFVVLETVSKSLPLAKILSAASCQQIADRHRGIGCDQMLLIGQSSYPKADFDYTIFNADGSESEQCGNGARCVGRFLKEQRLTDKSHIILHTRGRLTELHVTQDFGKIRVNMGVPSIEAEFAWEQAVGTAVSMGNPHAVFFVADLNACPLEQWGRLLNPAHPSERHALFPQGVNVNMAQVISRSQIRLRVYERGVGETQACGSGACATFAAAHQQRLVDETASIALPGGMLDLEWQGDNSPIWMTGPAVTVFSGHYLVPVQPS